MNNTSTRRKPTRTVIILITAFCWIFFLAAAGFAGTTDDDFILDPDQRVRSANSPTDPELYAEWQNEPRWLSGVNWGGITFFGSIDRGRNFFGSTLADSQYVEVEIRFSNTETSLAQTYRRDLGYLASGVGTFPGSAWDVSDPQNPRRLNICFVEWEDGSGAKPPNHQWDPDGSSLGGREYLFIMNSDYDGTGTTYNNVNYGPSADVLYALWPRLEAGRTLLESDPSFLRLKLSDFKHFRGIPAPGSVTLTWQVGNPVINEVDILVGSSSGTETRVATIPASQETYTVSGLPNKVPQFFELQGRDAGQNVFNSSEITVTPQSMGSNMTLLTALHNHSSYGDIWGYTDPGTGREYALICARDEGLGIVDINGPEAVEVGFAPSVTPGVDSKDVKVYDHYAILINENAPAQIIDIADPANPVQVSTIHIGTANTQGGAHNAFVDGHFLYTMGNHNVGGLIIYDLIDPVNPVKVGEFQPYYYHDIYMRNDTVYAAAIFGQGVDIINAADKANLTLIKNFNYTGSGAHNIWVTDDGSFVFVGDEIGSAGNWARIFDVRNLNSIRQVANYVVNPAGVIHNFYGRGNLLYVAYYTEGARVVDISNPATPVEVAYYDTYQPASGKFEGAWSVYPYFASGKIIVSDMNTGLYVLKLNDTVTDIQEPQAVPRSFQLSQNFPNPFNPSTNIEFTLPKQGNVNIIVYNTLGQKIATLANGRFSPGAHSVKWNGRDSRGRAVASGIYLYRMRFNGQVVTKKMVLLR